MAKRSTPEVNAGSMADIAFLLLIFFLVSTTMNVDSGIQRILPPLADEKQQQDTKVNERNIMLVMVNQYNNLLINSRETIALSDLTNRAKEFILNPTESPELPEKEIIAIDLLGDFPVSKGVISLQNQRPTSYDMYIKVQNELTRAFNEIKNDLSVTKFGKPFADLKDEAQIDAINKAIPLRISEAEPRK